MAYTLHNLGYETVPTSSGCYSTLITIHNQGGKNECIRLRADELNIAFLIDIDEWPLVAKAVERLLADRQPKEEAFKPAVTKEFLYEIDFVKDSAIEVLSGDHRALIGAFSWPSTAQGHRYWEDRERGEVELSDDDKALLQSWVDAADYYEKGND